VRPRRAKAWRFNLALLVITGYAAVMGLWIGYSLPMRYDEAFTANHFILWPLSESLSNYVVPNNHLLNTLLAHLSVSAFGNSPLAMRLPAIFSAVLLVPIAYTALSHLYGKGAALTGCALFVSSGLFIEYSANSRGYSAVALFSYAAAVCAGRALRSNRGIDWALLGLSFSLGFYAIPTMVYAFLAVNFWIACSIALRRRWELAGRFAIMLASTAALVSALYAPVVVKASLKAITANQFIEPVAWADLPARAVHSMLSTLNLFHLGLPEPIAYFFDLCVVLAMERDLASKRARRLVVAAVIAGLAIPLVWKRILPPERTWFMPEPLYWVAGCSVIISVWQRFRLPRSWIPTAAVLTLLLLAPMSIVRHDSIFRAGTFRAAAAIERDLQPLLGPADALLAKIPSDAPLEYYASTTSGAPIAFVADPETQLNAYSRRHPESLRNPDCWDRVFAAVNEDERQHVEELLPILAAPAGQQLRTELFRRYPGGAVYLVTRTGEHVAPSTPDEVLRNPGFDAGTLCWIDWKNSRSAGGLLMVGEGAGGRMQPVFLQPGSDYVLKVRGRLAGARDGGEAYFGVSMVSASGREAKIQGMIKTAVFSDEQIRFHVPPDLRMAWVWCWKTPGHSTFLIDFFACHRVR
jgi:4-amino-4-deoxy-L-arabinose transferase-like glycosyltransferase